MYVCLSVDDIIHQGCLARGQATPSIEIDLPIHPSTWHDTVELEGVEEEFRLVKQTRLGLVNWREGNGIPAFKHQVTEVEEADGVYMFIWQQYWPFSLCHICSVDSQVK